MSNVEVIRIIGNEPEVILTIKRRKLEYFGHMMSERKYALLQLIIKGKIQGTRNIGKRRISLLEDLRDWYVCGSVKLFRVVA